jgi:hypothetical protein
LDSDKHKNGLNFSQTNLFTTNNKINKNDSQKKNVTFSSDVKNQQASIKAPTNLIPKKEDDEQEIIELEMIEDTEDWSNKRKE